VCAHVGFISNMFSNTSPQIKGFIMFTHISKSQVLRTLLKSSNPRLYRIYSCLRITGLYYIYSQPQILGFVVLHASPDHKNRHLYSCSQIADLDAFTVVPNTRPKIHAPQIPGFDVSSNVPYQAFTVIAAIRVFHYIQ
jgi:hypothetical protein